MSGSKSAREMDQNRGDGSILLVEDDPHDVKLIGEALAMVGLSVPLIHVEDGEQAIKYLSLKHQFNNPASFPLPNLLLLDLKMPKRTGFDVLEWIQSQKHLAELIVIVLTGSAREEDRTRARELGVRDFRVKPVSFFELVRIIGELATNWIGEIQRPAFFAQMDNRAANPPSRCE
jgi:CheY-like chemotaxis protein